MTGLIILIWSVDLCEHVCLGSKLSDCSCELIVALAMGNGG